MPQTIAVTESPMVEIISAFAVANQLIEAVAEEPGWYVLGAFFMPLTSQARLEAIGLVSEAGITMRARLFDLTEIAPVSGTVVVIEETVDTRKRSGSVELHGGRIYQMQCEVIGDEGFGVLRNLMLS